MAGGFQIVTRPELHDRVRRLFHEHSSQRLSVQALETLAVIAYRQPVTGPEIAEIRGVNTSGVIGTLVDRRLIKVVGRKAVIGRPFLYATTREFLDRFGLKDLTDLPKVEDMAEALGMEVPPALAGDDPRDAALPFETPSGIVRGAGRRRREGPLNPGLPACLPLNGWSSRRSLSKGPCGCRSCCRRPGSRPGGRPSSSSRTAAWR